MFTKIIASIPRLLIEVFRLRYLPYHISAIVITFICVMSGFDWWYFELTRSNILQNATLPSAILGFFIPILVPVGMYIVGEVHNRTETMRNAITLLQSALVAWLVSSTYKAFTGRIQPEFLTHISSTDISHAFHFGFLQHGIFWGWPSSHTAVAFAGTITLMLLYPKNKYIRFIAPLYALYIGLGVSVSIHWFSDFLAGAIIGTLIGVVVAQNVQSIHEFNRL